MDSFMCFSFFGPTFLINNKDLYMIRSCRCQKIHDQCKEIIPNFLAIIPPYPCHYLEEKWDKNFGKCESNTRGVDVPGQQQTRVGYLRAR